ncbi:SapC family protein [Xenophilus sp. Marseille-Q4582]|uniref:SapC family protein n=1 Tax=Xenophilus sp. Marseille-Q4582 TaxID=2866600 RepID=UPI001CE3EE3E|nr:SapC family protein [Xenophilus sp. Marseille-Q4582]
MLFSHHEPLDREKHAGLRFSPRQTWQFAAEELRIPVVSGEALLLAREYVLAFPLAEGGLPHALTGIRTNTYVNAKGQWNARQVPVHVRRYPFVLAEHPATAQSSETRRDFTLHVVPQAPHFAAGKGVALFGASGAPAPVLEEVQKLLVRLHADTELTQFLVQQLREAGLLVERELRLQAAAGGPVAVVQGQALVDEQALAALSPEVLLRLRDTGALALVHAHRVSLTNLVDSRWACVFADQPVGASHAPLPAASALRSALAGLSTRPKVDAPADAAGRLRAVLAGKK